jgi:hypothetical protein
MITEDRKNALSREAADAIHNAFSARPAIRTDLVVRDVEERQFVVDSIIEGSNLVSIQIDDVDSR